MASSRKNRPLYIDTEALSTLALVQAGLISPVTELMNEKVAKEVDKSKMYKGYPYPFAFILAPKGEQNRIVLLSAKRGEVLDFIIRGKKVGEIVVDETFAINPKKRLKLIYGTSDTDHPGVKNTVSRLGDIAVCGEYKVEYPLIENNIKRIKSTIESTGSLKVSAMMLAANPFNRAHERMIRQTLSSSDLLVIFLRKPFTTEGLRYDIRHNALTTFIDNYLPRNRVIVVPFENTYIFAGYNELILDALLAKNYGCDELVIGKNHAGLGLYYDKNRLNSIFDSSKTLDINIKTVDEYVYCDSCNTLVSTRTCPHGQHHHTHYHSPTIMKLIQSGIIPPAILVRKEVSASILASLFPDRFENLHQMHYSIMPNSGLLEEPNEEQFYIKLAELYQTSSLT
jgi:sulfate adenylyltransferase